MRDINCYKNFSGDPSNVEKHVKSELTSLEKQLPFLINNYNMKILSWTTKIDTAFNDSINFSKNRTMTDEKIAENAQHKCKLIIEGLSIAN